MYARFTSEVQEHPGDFMNIIRTAKAARSGWIATGTVILLLAFSASLGAQEKEKHPSKPAPTHSAPTKSAPQHSEAPRQAETPHHAEAPHQGGNSTPPNNAGRNAGNTASPNSGNRPGSTTVSSPNNRPANNSGTRSGSTTVYPNNRPANNAPPANNGNNRPGGGTVYSPNNRPAGNPGGGFNNRPGGNNANSVNGRTSFPARATIYHAPGGGQVQTRADGSIREVHTANGAIIHHAPDGARRVEVVRPGGRVIVANTRGSGYVQRPLVVGRTTFIQRTYVVNNVSYARVYRPWAWGGVSFSVYTPVRFYSPGFYAYAWTPWARPVYYGWGWAGSPWYGFYGGWFTPYPYYASPALWLTDYLVAQSLQDAYQARMDAAAVAANAQAANYAATPLTPDVKQQIADEVKRQLEQERAEQQSMGSMQASGPPPIFSGNGPHVFVVATSLDVDSGGQTCPVTEGDVLQLSAPPPPGAQYAQVVVLASKGMDCRKGSTVSVALADLQEMQNQMRATIDQGLNDLQSKQGQGGLPTLPPSAAGQPTNAPYAAQVQPDANAASDLSQASQEADRAEQDVVNQSMPGAGGGAPATVALGQSIQEVEAIMGKPGNVADLGSKKIYVYRDLKITFVDGKVTDVQ
jgi:hypothetical protein